MKLAWAAAALATLSACGRIRFGARPSARTDAAADVPGADARTGHDEDGDGIPDVDDPCPQVPGDRADRDGDGVGDACDPNPDTPSEHWLVFATMQPGDTGFDDISGFEQEADDIHSTNGGFPVVTRAVGTVRVEIGFDIRGLVGTGQHQVASGIDNPGPEYYFVELNDNMGLRDLGVVQYDAATGYTTLGSQTNSGAQVGPGVLRYDATIGSAPIFSAIGGWNGEIDQASGPTASYTGGTAIKFAFNGVDVAVRYLAIVARN